MASRPGPKRAAVAPCSATAAAAEGIGAMPCVSKPSTAQARRLQRGRRLRGEPIVADICMPASVFEQVEPDTHAHAPPTLATATAGAGDVLAGMARRAAVLGKETCPPLTMRHATRR
jgi:hypothetical protein